jgi:hypothetical protein
MNNDIEVIKRYTTAQATIGCVHFAKDEFVAVTYDAQRDGVHWFLVTANERGPLESPVAYPAHHLTRFTL